MLISQRVGYNLSWRHTDNRDCIIRNAEHANHCSNGWLRGGRCDPYFYAIGRFFHPQANYTLYTKQLVTQRSAKPRQVREGSADSRHNVAAGRLVGAEFVVNQTNNPVEII